MIRVLAKYVNIALIFSLILLGIVGCGGNVCDVSVEERANAREAIDEAGYGFSVRSFLKYWNEGNEEVIASYWRAGIAEAFDGKDLVSIIENETRNQSELLNQAKKCGVDLSVDGLRAATRSESLTAVRVLIEHGANVNAEQKYGVRPIHWAAENNSTEIVQLLLENGASVQQEGQKVAPLHFAARGEGKETVRILIENGANVNARLSDGTTPLHRAADANNVAAARILLENGAEVNARSTGEEMAATYADETTPLHWAVRQENKEIVQLLVENGANVNAKDKKERTPLHYAVTDQKKEMMKLLIENGANVNAKLPDGTTPLHIAVSHRFNKEEVRILLENGAEVNARSTGKRVDGTWAAGSTPLHWAVRKNDEKTVQRLVENGANVNAKNEKGETPIDYVGKYCDFCSELKSIMKGKGE